LNIEAVRVIVKSMRRQIYKPCESACRVFESVEAERLLIEAVRVNSVADPGSGIGCFFDPWIRDPGWEKVSIRIQDPGSGMNNPDHIF
jgi:hypothetical protein